LDEASREGRRNKIKRKLVKAIMWAIKDEKEKG
jgi:hypothetical protein